MTTPTEKLDGLLLKARAAAEKLAYELEIALELVRDEESLEVDLEQLVKDWNRARTVLAMAVFGQSTLPDGGLNACETAIANRRRVTELEAEIVRVRKEIGYLEQSPGGLADELSDVLAGKRNQIAELESELAAIKPAQPPSPVRAPEPAPAPKRASTSTAPAEPLPDLIRSSEPGPKRCGVCLEIKKLSRVGGGWRCPKCGHLEQEIASARKALNALGAKPLGQPGRSDLPGTARIREEGEQAMADLESRRRRPPVAASKPARRPAPGRVNTDDPTVHDLRQRWNSRS
ncbi:hypothetical protein [Rhodococcus sp. NPDC049939]|uniref:hypothetical protein n=1 Tax=Rhodococcus sp. NPDC049939 TaxID=3155511 RepID=UPI0033F55B6F